MRKWVKRKSLAISVLRNIGTVGLALIAISSPYFGLGLIRGFKKRYDKKEWRRFYLSLNYLNRRGYVQILNSDDGRIKVKITQRGKQAIEHANIDSMELPRNQNWDGKWRIIAFDVPNTKSKNRVAFTEKLKELGLIMVQKSIWAYPFECYKEMMILRKFYEIEPFVSYFKAVEIEDELAWRREFNLKN